jgi:hypothetical protein
MKTLVYLLAASLMTSVAFANLLQNEEFDNGQAGWSVSSGYDEYFYTDGPDTIASMGGWGNDVDWSNTSLWQASAFSFVADTVYTLTVTWRNAPGETPTDNVRLVLYEIDNGTNWTVVADGIYTTALGTNWNTSNLILDTATSTSVVGKTIGVSFDLTSGTGTWVHVDRISLSPDALPPAISQEPVNQTVYTNVTATFSVTPVGTPTPTVQWYEVDGAVTNTINGATNSSYTTPAATLAMSGISYYAVALNSFGSVTSTSALLSVQVPAVDARETFSVQLANPGKGGYQALSPTDLIGAFPSTNWNTPWVNDVNGSEAQILPLNDQYGIGTDVKLIVVGASDSAIHNDPQTDTNAISKLMNTFIKTWYRPDAGSPNELGEGKMQLILTNLDASTYNAYVYLGDDWGRQADIDAGTGVTNYTGAMPDSLPTAFLPSTNQDPDDGNRDDGNYVRLTGLVPVSGTLTITVNYYDPPWEGYGAGVCGLQVVKASADVFAPSFAAPPASQRVLTNTPATFTAWVVGAPYPAIQWYEVISGVATAIPGATNVTYTTAPVTDAMNCQGYYAVASNGSGSATSGVATLTAAHLVPAPGLLQVDQYFGANILPDVLDFGWLAANTPPSNTLWISTFEHQSALPDSSSERIYGWFTPPVTTNYVFFISADDESMLLLSTDSSPANRHEIALEEFWSADGNNWTNSGGGSTLSQKRSDTYSPIGLVATGWPGGGNNILLTAGTPYYIEVGHVQGGGGQSAAVTYKFAGAPDPADGTPTVITSDQLSTMSAPDYLLPQPEPMIVNVITSGSNVTLSGTNGLLNAVYHVMSSTDVSLPVGSWTAVATNCFDLSGNFNETIAQNPGEPTRYYRLLVQ